MIATLPLKKVTVGRSAGAVALRHEFTMRGFLRVSVFGLGRVCTFAFLFVHQTRRPLGRRGLHGSWTPPRQSLRGCLA